MISQACRRISRTHRRSRLSHSHMIIENPRLGREKKGGEAMRNCLAPVSRLTRRRFQAWQVMSLVPDSGPVLV